MGASLLYLLSFHSHSKYVSYEIIKLLLNSWKITNVAALLWNNKIEDGKGRAREALFQFSLSFKNLKIFS